MAGKNLVKELDGGPHEDPRELEAEELLNDGEDEEVKTATDDDENWDFSDEGGEKGTGKKKAGPAEEEKEVEADKEEPVEAEKEEEKPEVEEEVEIEAKTEPTEEEKKEEEKPAEKEDERTKYQTIPYSRFRKELVKRHAMAEELAQVQARMKQMEEQIKAGSAAAGKAADPEPDKDLDPLGHTQWQVRKLTQEIAEAKRAQEKPEQVFLTNEEVPRLRAAYLEAVEGYAEEHPEFNDAYRFAIQATAQRLIAQNPTATQEQVNQTVQYLELQEVKSALQAGQDPAERVVDIARRLGYAPAARQERSVEEKNTVTEKVKAAADEAARKKRAGSVVGKGTTLTRRPLTEQDIEGMSNEEMVKFMDRNSGRSNPLMP